MDSVVTTTSHSPAVPPAGDPVVGVNVGTPVGVADVGTFVGGVEGTVVGDSVVIVGSAEVGRTVGSTVANPKPSDPEPLLESPSSREDPIDGWEEGA